jgi:uncharacterized membrane protein
MQIRGFWAGAILVLLFLSLGANFFMAGFMAERWRSGGRFFGPPPSAQIMADFPPDIRRAIGRELWSDRARFREVFDDVREKRRAVVETMRAPTLDEARLRAQMGEVRALTARIQERAQDVTIDVLRRTSPEERAQIGERRRWRGEGGPPWRGRDGGL